jgi:hypothetical protein
VSFFAVGRAPSADVPFTVSALFIRSKDATLCPKADRSPDPPYFFDVNPAPRKFLANALITLAKKTFPALQVIYGLWRTMNLNRDLA